VLDGFDAECRIKFLVSDWQGKLGQGPSGDCTEDISLLDEVDLGLADFNPRSLSTCVKLDGSTWGKIALPQATSTTDLTFLGMRRMTGRANSTEAEMGWSFVASSGSG
jgi:hypothetical protein